MGRLSPRPGKNTSASMPAPGSWEVRVSNVDRPTSQVPQAWDRQASSCRAPFPGGEVNRGCGDVGGCWQPRWECDGLRWLRPHERAMIRPQWLFLTPATGWSGSTTSLIPVFLGLDNGRVKVPGRELRSYTRVPPIRSHPPPSESLLQGGHPSGEPLERGFVRPVQLKRRQRDAAIFERPEVACRDRAFRS